MRASIRGSHTRIPSRAAPDITGTGGTSGRGVSALQVTDMGTCSNLASVRNACAESRRANFSSARDYLADPSKGF